MAEELSVNYGNSKGRDIKIQHVGKAMRIHAGV
jgi:hypothetical protein